MFTNNYKFAGHIVEICSIHEWIHKLAKDYKTDEQAEFKISITQQDIETERQMSKETLEAEGAAPQNFSDAYLESTAVYRKLADYLIDKGIILMHGSVIAVDGVAYMFTAKSGTGKSTHSRIWREHFGDRAVMVNDDKPLISVNGEGPAIAYGTPWNGKHNLGENIQAPLKAICWLERDITNHITEISTAEMMDTLVYQTHRPEDPMLVVKVLALLNQLCKKVKFYRLGCNMEPEAAITAYEGMNK